MFVDRGGSRHTEPNRQAHRLLWEKKNASQQQHEGCCEPRSTEWAHDSIRAAASPRQHKKYVGFAGMGRRQRSVRRFSRLISIMGGLNKV